MVRYDASYGGIGRMLCSPWMVAEMHRRIKLAEAVAVATAPVYLKGPHPGRYRGAFETSADVRPGPKPRARGRLTNTSPEAFLVEWGNVNTPRHRTMGTALMAAVGKP